MMLNYAVGEGLGPPVLFYIQKNKTKTIVKIKEPWYNKAVTQNLINKLLNAPLCLFFFIGVLFLMPIANNEFVKMQIPLGYGIGCADRLLSFV